MNDKEDIKSDEHLRVTMVGYLNTVPLVYGLEHGQGTYDLQLHIPAACFSAFDAGEADVALVPVGVLPLLGERASVITDNCIGCQSDVRTVCLLSDTPIERIQKIYLDTDSRTSVLLVRVLMAHHWVQEVHYESIEVSNLSPSMLEEGEAVLMIGDKVFETEGEYSYSYDLGRHWYEFTGLPFAFAVWVAGPSVSREQIAQLEKDLAYGVEHTTESLAIYPQENRIFDLQEYFDKHIDYYFDDQKREALHVFLQLINGLPNQTF